VFDALSGQLYNQGIIRIVRQIRLPGQAANKPALRRLNMSGKKVLVLLESLKMKNSVYMLYRDTPPSSKQVYGT
jgi:hypothetical protein